MQVFSRIFTLPMMVISLSRLMEENMRRIKNRTQRIETIRGRLAEAKKYKGRKQKK